MAEMSAWISAFFSILSMRARSTLRILPRMGRMAWVRGLRASLAEPPAEFPSTMNSSDSRGSRDEQSANLPGSPAPSSADLRRVRSRAPCAAMRARAACSRLLHDLAGLARVLLQPLVQLLVGGLLHQGTDAHVAQLGLGLPLELRVA
jgi:hypothetical protein